jgi:Glycosyl transferase family 2
MRSPVRHPLVSIVILSYNYGRYLAQCIESALTQDYQPLEVIVVDDGSTDDSREVIERYGSRVITRFKANGGEASAMNAGFAASSGTIVLFVDSDDYLLQGAVSAHVRMLRLPGVVRSQGYLEVLRGAQLSGERLPSVPVADGDLRDRLLARGPGAYVSPPNSGNAWSRSFLECVFPLPETPRTIGGETFLMDTAPLFGSSRTIAAQSTGVYRRHEASTSGLTAELTAENIRTVIDHREARIAWLERTARALGHEPGVDLWRAGNWRMQTLAVLDGRLRGVTPAPPLQTHLGAAFTAALPRVACSALAVALLAIRVAPLPLALGIARRLIALRYM